MSILMYNQEFHHKKLFFFFVSLMPRGSQQGTHSPKVSNLYDQEYNVVYTQNFNFFLIFKFQCKHSHNYNDVLFHVFADCQISSPRGADLEHIMRESLMLFIKENREKVTTIAAPFLKKKKLSLDEYIEFMSTPGHQGMSWQYISLL